MIRTIIKIDQDKCNGCGACADACAEGAIAMIDGKATLVRDDYCDGLGACLPACPVDALSFEEREAVAFDEEAVKLHMERLAQEEQKLTPCVDEKTPAKKEDLPRNFPVQLQLVAENAYFLDGADLLISADCAAYCDGDFHKRLMKNRVTLIGCPKLDHADYAAKLATILKLNDIRSLTLVQMEVPCCGGLERAVKAALAACGKHIPSQVLTMSTKGEILA